jgi:hypothetical protein
MEDYFQWLADKRCADRKETATPGRGKGHRPGHAAARGSRGEELGFILPFSVCSVNPQAAAPGGYPWHFDFGWHSWVSPLGPGGPIS